MRPSTNSARWQCELCPKHFTRLFALKAHLRNHTNERPFQCKVCGKSFTRNHDRKSHEQIHGGERSFVCKGELQDGQWGCGRRFNRASNLERHFRSTTGKRCRKPLLDEEAANCNATGTSIRTTGTESGPGTELTVSSQGSTLITPSQSGVTDITETPPTTREDGWNKAQFCSPSDIFNSGSHHSSCHGLNQDQVERWYKRDLPVCVS